MQKPRGLIASMVLITAFLLVGPTAWGEAPLIYKWAYQPMQLKGIPGTHFVGILSMNWDGTYYISEYDRKAEHFPQQHIVGKWSFFPAGHKNTIIYHYEKNGKPTIDYCILLQRNSPPSEWEMRCADAGPNGEVPSVIQKVIDGTMSARAALQHGQGFKDRTMVLSSQIKATIAPCWEGFTYPNVSPQLPNGTPYIEIWKSNGGRTYRLAILEILIGSSSLGQFPYSGPPLVALDGLLFEDGIIRNGNGVLGSYSMSDKEELALNFKTDKLEVATVDQRIEFKFDKYSMTVPRRCLAHTEAFYTPRK